MREYLKETKNMNYSHPAIKGLIAERGWDKLDDYHKIEAVYNFVKDEILFGYNVGDNIKASEVLSDGIGQCNTKATLLMTLLRAVGLPTRIHVFDLNHEVQEGVLSPAIYKLAPSLIIHTWAEVYYQNKWVILEGVILDKQYISGYQKVCKAKGISGKNYKGFAFGVEDLYNLDVEWKGEDTFVQATGIVNDLGIYSSSDQCFSQHSQKIGRIKNWIYMNITRKSMNARVAKIRAGKSL